MNWRALEGFPDLLVRRSKEPDEWVIAARKDSTGESRWPDKDGAWAGHLGFRLSESVDHVVSRFPEDAWAGSRWWRPELVLTGTSNKLEPMTAQGVDPSLSPELLKELLKDPAAVGVTPAPIEWHRHTPKERYLATVERLLGHIQRGDIYEVNYCTERSAVLKDFDPFASFGRLLGRTDAPFAALYRWNDLFALCMSPESFLRIERAQAITRPMKGTRPRSADPVEDGELAQELARDPKERSENIMAVDVARHDLSRIAASGSVQVDELCAVKTYPKVHQLVSTVSARLREGVGAWDVVKAAFPMASMTGAPKRRALQLIDEVEDGPRGLFSGSLGYQLPDGTLDLNVVIRTITYDASTGRASLITGSAITALSDPEREWEACELKARSVLNALI